MNTLLIKDLSSLTIMKFKKLLVCSSMEGIVDGKQVGPDYYFSQEAQAHLKTKNASDALLDVRIAQRNHLLSDEEKFETMLMHLMRGSNMTKVEFLKLLDGWTDFRDLTQQIDELWNK